MRRNRVLGLACAIAFCVVSPAAMARPIKDRLPAATPDTVRGTWLGMLKDGPVWIEFRVDGTGCGLGIGHTTGMTFAYTGVLPRVRAGRIHAVLSGTSGTVRIRGIGFATSARGVLDVELRESDGGLIGKVQLIRDDPALLEQLQRMAKSAGDAVSSAMKARGPGGG